MNFRRMIQLMSAAWVTRERETLAVDTPIKTAPYTLPAGSVVEHENRLLWVVSTVLDLLSARVLLGVLYTHPTQGPDDARAQIGRDRRVIRGPSESSAAYDVRLIRAVTDQKQKGSPAALLNQIAGYLTPFACVLRCVDASGNWVTRNADGTFNYSHYYAANWNWDGHAVDVDVADAWARFWVIIYPGATGLCANSGQIDGTGPIDEPGATIETTLTADQCTSIANLMLDWRPLGVSPQWFVIAFDDASFSPTSPEPDGWWEYPGKQSGVQVISARLETARYGFVAGINNYAPV